MQKESRVIFMILLGVLLAVAIGINVKLRVREALSKQKVTSSMKKAVGESTKKKKTAKITRRNKPCTEKKLYTTNLTTNNITKWDTRSVPTCHYVIPTRRGVKSLSFLITW